MILIKNGRVIDPSSNKDAVLDILINDNKIEKIGKFPVTSKYDKIIDASGYVVAPGLIDVHVHLNGSEVINNEDIQIGALAAAKGGFTTVVCMPNTSCDVKASTEVKDSLLIKNEERIDFINSNSKIPKINILHLESLTKDNKGDELVDLESLVNLGTVGFSDGEVAIKENKLVLKAMCQAERLNIPISFHNEDLSMINDLDTLSKASEEVTVGRYCMLSLSTSAKVNIQHITTENSVEIIRTCKKLGANIYTEVTPHHFSLTDSDINKFKTNAKVSPPLRSEDDKFKIIEGLLDDTIDIIASDHTPQTKEAKDVDYKDAASGIIGLETSLALGITNLVRKGHLSIMKLIEKMTVNPARLYNLDRGIIKEEAIADLTIFAPTEKFIIEEFVCKSTNSPFKDIELYGKVKYTICNGEIVYEDIVSN